METGNKRGVVETCFRCWLGFAALLAFMPVSFAGGNIEGDPELDVPWSEFEPFLDAALVALAKINPQAASDLGNLKAGNGGYIAPLPPVKDGGTVYAPDAGSYEVLTNPGGLPLVLIRLSIFGIDDPSMLCGTLLHEWEHWQGDKANDPAGEGGVDGDTGVLSELPKDATDEDKAKYRLHADQQLQIALDLCYANYSSGTTLGILTCAALEAEYNSAQAHYAKLADLGMIAAIQAMIDSIADECSCHDYVF
jgi:hypothetical protein